MNQILIKILFLTQIASLSAMYNPLMNNKNHSLVTIHRVNKEAFERLKTYEAYDIETDRYDYKPASDIYIHRSDSHNPQAKTSFVGVYVKKRSEADWFYAIKEPYSSQSHDLNQKITIGEVTIPALYLKPTDGYCWMAVFPISTVILES